MGCSAAYFLGISAKWAENNEKIKMRESYLQTYPQVWWICFLLKQNPEDCSRPQRIIFHGHE